MHKGTAYPGEHDAIVTQAQWDAVHAGLQVSPRVRRNRARCETPALLRGQIYRYYVSRSVLKGGAADEPAIRRLPAGEIEAAVMAQVRALLRQPEIVVGTWRAAQLQDGSVTEAEVRTALEQLDPLWDEMFPAEQARIVWLLVDRVDVGAVGADVRLRLDGLASLTRDMAARPADADRAAA